MSENQTNSKRNILMISSLVVVLMLVLGISFAYFLAQGQSAEQTITTSNLGITFGDGTAIMNASDIAPLIREDALPTQDSSGKVTTPGKAVTKKFTIKNTGTEKMFIHISLEDMTLPTNLKRYDFMWSLYEVTDTTNNIEKNVSNGTFLIEEDNMDIAPYQVFESDEEKTYNLYIWIEETYLNQSAMMGQEFKATIQAEGEVYWTSPESDFIVNEAGILLEYIGNDTTVVIPPVVNGITVTKIGGENDTNEMGAFFSKNATNVIIPNTVTSIGDVAFGFSKINDIFIPNSVTIIDAFAFMDTPLKFISIPNSVTILGYDFLSNTKIKSIFIPNSISILNPFRCDIENIITPNSITEIREEAYINISSETIVIPASVTKVSSRHSGVFSENLSEVIILGKRSLDQFEDSTGLTIEGGLPENVTITFKP